MCMSFVVMSVTVVVAVALLALGIAGFWFGLTHLSVDTFTFDLKDEKVHTCQLLCCAIILATCIRFIHDRCWCTKTI